MWLGRLASEVWLISIVLKWLIDPAHVPRYEIVISTKHYHQTEHSSEDKRESRAHAANCACTATVWWIVLSNCRRYLQSRTRPRPHLLLDSPQLSDNPASNPANIVHSWEEELAAKQEVANSHWCTNYRMVQKISRMFEFPSLLLPTNFGQPMHSPWLKHPLAPSPNFENIFAQPCILLSSVSVIVCRSAITLDRKMEEGPCAMDWIYYPNRDNAML